MRCLERRAWLCFEEVVRWFSEFFFRFLLKVFANFCEGEVSFFLLFKPSLVSFGRTSVMGLYRGLPSEPARDGTEGRGVSVHFFVHLLFFAFLVIFYFGPYLGGLLVIFLIMFLGFVSKSKLRWPQSGLLFLDFPVAKHAPQDESPVKGWGILVNGGVPLAGGCLFLLV